eukprot:gene20728-27543_t
MRRPSDSSSSIQLHSSARPFLKASPISAALTGLANSGATTSSSARQPCCSNDATSAYPLHNTNLLLQWTSSISRTTSQHGRMPKQEPYYARTSIIARVRSALRALKAPADAVKLAVDGFPGPVNPAGYYSSSSYIQIQSAATTLYIPLSNALGLLRGPGAMLTVDPLLHWTTQLQVLLLFLLLPLFHSTLLRLGPAAWAWWHADGGSIAALDHSASGVLTTPPLMRTLFPLFLLLALLLLLFLLLPLYHSTLQRLGPAAWAWCHADGGFYCIVLPCTDPNALGLLHGPGGMLTEDCPALF